MAFESDAGFLLEVYVAVLPICLATAEWCTTQRYNKLYILQRELLYTIAVHIKILVIMSRPLCSCAPGVQVRPIDHMSTGHLKREENTTVKLQHQSYTCISCAARTISGWIGSVMI